MINHPNFKTYIYRKLKNMKSDAGISGTALACLNNLIGINIEKLMIGVNQIILHIDKKTITDKEVLGSINLFLSGDLLEQVKKYTKDALENFEKSKDGEKKNTSTSKSASAGLIFPVTRIQNYMIKVSVTTRKSEKAAVAMAAVCELLISNLLEKTFLIAEKHKKSRITTRHIMIAINDDFELKHFYKNCVFAGGVVQYNPNFKK